MAATFDAFSGRVPEECLKALSIEDSSRNWTRFLDSESLLCEREILLVAEDRTDSPIAFVLAGRSTSDVIEDPTVAATYPREITSLQVKPAWHRQGIGRQLVKAIAVDFRKRGNKSIAVRVLEPNPNVSFYTHLGACQVSSQRYDWEGFTTRELIFGWEDIGDV